MTAKELVGRFFDLRDEGWRDVPLQMKFAKGLVQKYTDEQLIMALELYYTQMYSLAFLNERNMGRAIEKCKSKVNINYEVGGDIAERNRNKLQKFTYESRFRERDFECLFEEQ